MMRKKLVSVIILLFMATCASYPQEQGFKFLHSIGGTEYQEINYQNLDQTYHIYVLTPEIIEPNQKYPTVYLLDGGITYPLLSSYYKYLRLGDEVPEMIIVGISYGTNDWRKGNARSRDFTTKSEERSFWGGAPDFMEFLSSELFPLIESTYPSDATHRIVFGQSLGGQFVLYAALSNPGLFWGHIASNPALHRNLDFFLESTTGSNTNNNRPRLFVSSGSQDDLRFREPALKWIKFWNEQKNTPWVLKTTTLEGHNHFSAGPEAFRQGMRWIFSEN